MIHPLDGSSLELRGYLYCTFESTTLADKLESEKREEGFRGDAARPDTMTDDGRVSCGETDLKKSVSAFACLLASDVV